MPARVVQITLKNSSSFPIKWHDDHLDHGSWTNPLWPSKITNLLPGGSGSFRAESDGTLTGTEGWAEFVVDISAVITNAPSEMIKVWWDMDYFDTGNTDFGLSCTQTDQTQPKRVFANLAGEASLGSDDSSGRGFNWSNAASAPISAAVPVVGPVISFVVSANTHHIEIGYEIFNSESPSVIPSRLTNDTEGVIYAIVGKNDLLWFHHTGWQDGTFEWQFNEGKKVGNNWDFKRVFSGGNGIIYALANNGDLLWFHHTGRQDGTFEWQFNEGKKVGNNWDFKQVFSGG